MKKEKDKEVISINLFAGEKAQDDMLHNLDLFEPYKRLGQTMCISGYEIEKSEPDLAFILRLKEQFEKGGYVVTAIWIAQHPEVNYVDWSIQVVSDGNKWTVLKDYLKQFGITDPKDITEQNTKS